MEWRNIDVTCPEEAMDVNDGEFDDSMRED